MEPTQEQIIQEQIAEKARHVAMVASASGKLAVDASVSALKGAESVGDKAVLFGALAGLVSFFMPWVSLFGLSGSGFRAAKDFSNFLWLHPLSMIACVILALATRSGTSKELILAARWYILAGTVWFGPGVGAISQLSSSTLGIGCYLAVLSAGAILVGGFLQVSERLQGQCDSTAAGIAGEHR